MTAATFLGIFAAFGVGIGAASVILAATLIIGTLMRRNE